MSEPTQADRYLLEQIRQGSGEGWAQLVQRYSGRLLAFARAKLGRSADVEDLVQETFVGFLKGVRDYREEASLETYLFGILRRRIADWYRGRRTTVALLQDVLGSPADAAESSDAAAQLMAPGATASWYARRDERHDLAKAALAAALAEVVGGLTESLKFRDLKVVELLFYVQLRNKDVAAIVNLPETQIALLKHRYLKQIQQRVGRDRRLRSVLPDLEGDAPGEARGPLDAVLTEIWQEQRLSCLKRGTIGAYMLGTLEPPWQDYAAFHLERLGCQFCRANVDDLQRQTAAGETAALRERIFNSTAGFLRKAENDGTRREGLRTSASGEPADGGVD